MPRGEIEAVKREVLEIVAVCVQQRACGTSPVVVIQLARRWCEGTEHVHPRVAVATGSRKGMSEGDTSGCGNDPGKEVQDCVTKDASIR